jgi:hypothetical protein
MNEWLKKFQAVCSPNPDHSGSHSLYNFLLTAYMKQLEIHIWIFMKFETVAFHEKDLSHFSFNLEWRILAATSHKDLHTYILACISNVTR